MGQRRRLFAAALYFDTPVTRLHETDVTHRSRPIDGKHVNTVPRGTKESALTLLRKRVQGEWNDSDDRQPLFRTQEHTHRVFRVPVDVRWISNQAVAHSASSGSLRTLTVGSSVGPIGVR